MCVIWTKLEDYEMFRLSFNEGFDEVWETWGYYETRDDAQDALRDNPARNAWSWWIEKLED